MYRAFAALLNAFSRLGEQGRYLQRAIRAVAVDRIARSQLRESLVAYMTGAIGTFAFDDRNSECGESSDNSVRQISECLYHIHDDTEGWNVLRRIVAFLDTDQSGGGANTDSPVIVPPHFTFKFKGNGSTVQIIDYIATSDSHDTMIVGGYRSSGPYDMGRFLLARQ